MLNGSFRILRLWGIDVFLHWSWLLVAFFEIRSGARYGSLAGSIAEYLSLFGIVLVHEFGHALAARTVGGRSEQIVLWPLGGIAFVQIPPRPGATLWTIAAGPLVNVAFVPLFAWAALLVGVPAGGESTGLLAVLKAPLVMSRASLLAVFPSAEFLLNQDVYTLLSWLNDHPSDFHSFIIWISLINLVVLVFNLIPAYPLDGGKIFQALLWFVVGRTASMRIAGVVGLLFAGLLGAWGLYDMNFLRIVLALFIGSLAWKAMFAPIPPDVPPGPAVNG